MRTSASRLSAASYHSRVMPLCPSSSSFRHTGELTTQLGFTGACELNWKFVDLRGSPSHVDTSVRMPVGRAQPRSIQDISFSLETGATSSRASFPLLYARGLALKDKVERP